MNPQRDKTLSDAVEQHGGRLRTVVRGLIRDQVEAEDVLQDVYEELITAYDLGVATYALGSWLMTVARNKVLDRFRRRKTRTDYEQAVAKQDRGFDQGGEESSVLREEILAGLELLPREQRQAFVMYELEGKSFKEMAEETKVPIGTLMARKKYAVDFLREYLKEFDDESE